MIKTHPITKIQLWVALIWGVTSIVVLEVNSEAAEVWLFVNLILFICLGGITFYLGWLMLVKKAIILYPYEVFLIRTFRRRNNQKRAYQIQKNGESDKKRKYYGAMNLFSGFLCLMIGLLVLIFV